MGLTWFAESPRVVRFTENTLCAPGIEGCILSFLERQVLQTTLLGGVGFSSLLRAHSCLSRKGPKQELRGRCALGFRSAEGHRALNRQHRAHRRRLETFVGAYRHLRFTNTFTSLRASRGVAELHGDKPGPQPCSRKPPAAQPYRAWV